MVVNNWLGRYLEEGIEGLKTRAGRGRPPILSAQNPKHLKKVKAEIKKHPNSIKTVIAKLEEDLDLAMHPETLRRFLKKNEYRFRRARTSLKSRQVGAEREEKEKQLKFLWRLAAGERIDLYFGDESAFAMNPKLPDGWSPKDERIEIFPQRDKKINLFGMFRADNFAVTYESANNINGDFLIAAINDFCRYVDKPTVLVLDNASGASVEKVSRADGELDGRRLIYFLFAEVFAAFKFGRNVLAEAKYEPLATGGLWQF